MSKTAFYDIHGIIKLKSFTQLYEMEYFRSSDHDVRLDDIDISVGSDVDNPVYKDLLCSLSIELDDNENIYMGISNLLEWSKHVLYVNLVEPLLRLSLVPKGYALLHLACLEKDGEGIMISAPPDTGKTSCILKCLKDSNDNGGKLRLLSDDMIIAGMDGSLLSFPKPFTISSHTLDSVFGMNTDLWYKIRSRVHSKGGRSAYQDIGSVEWMPIMSINALAQIVFEPPKLYPNKIMEIKIGKSAIPKKLIFLSDEFVGEKEISRDDATKMILSNTDNAYKTPPYDKIFPNLTVGGMAYNDIIEEELKITRNLIENIDPMIIGRKDYSWYKYVLDCQ